MCDFRLQPQCELYFLFFLLVTQPRLIVIAVAEQPIGPTFKGQPLKVGPIGYPETSVTKYQSKPSNIPGQRKISREVFLKCS